MTTAQISQTTNNSKVDMATTLVVFDSRVSDLDLLYSALLPGSIGFTVKAKADGLATITQLLATTGAKYLSIVAHGEPGAVHLGQTTLNIGQLQAQSQLLQQWDVAEISLYSCEVAQGDLGRDFVYQLSELTGATVAAAATKTGNRLLGGSWDLTVTTGAIVAPKLFDTSILESYSAVLALSFGGTSYSTVGTSPYSVTVGDFNSDGNLDLATANYEGDDISVLLGNENGHFGAATNFTLGANRPAPIFVTKGDFNGDGTLDLAIANYRLGTVSVRLGSGNGGFGAATNLAVGSLPYSVTVGDFNGDGKLDLATANVSEGNVSVLLGNGNGGFGSATNLAVGNYPESITAGDFNGDGNMDLAAANRSDNTVSVLLGRGSGFDLFGNIVFRGFAAATNFAVGDNPSSITAGDFNGDGNMDLATANIASNNVSVLFGNKFGFVLDNNGLNFAVGDNPSSVTVGDFNGDGNMDLATANTGSRNVSVLSGNGTGGFDPATNFGVGTQPTAITAGDFNGDGKLDFATVSKSSSSVSIRLNTTVPTVPTLARNDFNGDGKSDILWRNDDGRVVLWQMDGKNVTTSSVVATAVPTVWQIVGTGDFNGDKKADILWRNTTDGSISIGQYSLPTAPPIIGAIPTALQVVGTGDFNGDGKSDILWRNTTNGDVSIWEMNGTASINQTVVSNADASWKVAGTGDFTGDGKSDVLWRNDDGSIALWQVSGTTVISSLTSTSRLDSSWKINGTADFNGDGKADILWRNDDGRVVLWQMDGKNVVSSLATSTPSADSTWKITGTSDFNSDGKADILWRNDSGSVAIWEMNGATVANASLTSTPLVDNSWKIAAPIL
jgi:Domain of unknown function (DUF4347)/FG-GAP-like repeat/FG-GAP repeat